MADVQQFLRKAMMIDGAIGVALVDSESGMCIGTKGGKQMDMELAGACSTQVVQANKNVIEQMNLDETPEEVLLTMDGQYHLIRLFRENDNVFSYLILNKDACRLALARTQLKSLDEDLSLDAVEPDQDIPVEGDTV